MKQLLIIRAQTVAYRDGSFVCCSPDAEPACRWCYGRPMPGMDVCSRVPCILNVAWLDSLPLVTAHDALGWHGDRP